MAGIPSELLAQIANPQGPQNVLEMFSRGSQQAYQNQQQAYQNQQMGRENRRYNALIEAGDQAAVGNYQGAATTALGAGEHQLGKDYISMSNDRKREAELNKILSPGQMPGPTSPNAPPMAVANGTEPQVQGQFSPATLAKARKALQIGGRAAAEKVLIDSLDSGGGMFGGNSVEAQALNYLVQTGQIDETTAANVAAGKPITDPATGQLMFVTPQQIMQAAQASGMGQQQGGQPTTGQIGTPLTGPKPPEAKFNQEQGNAATFADRIANSIPVIEKFGEAGTGLIDTMASKVPGVGNYLISDEFRQLDQAKRDFINAALRRESGATIGEHEIEEANRQYFPQPNDDPGTLELKRRNRQTVLNGMIRSAGPNYKPASPQQGAGQGTTSTNVPFKVLD
jgi:hypothetical protein